MKKILFSLAVLAGISATAQVKVGDNPTTIDANSVLELESTNRGLLLPRVALTSVKEAAPLTAHVAGITVYNTATAGSGVTAVSPGEYYNDGTQWVKKAGSTATLTPTKTVYINGTDPNTATQFDDTGYYSYNVVTETCSTNTAFVNDGTLAANTQYLYVGQTTCDADGDGSEYSYWIYNGSTYVPYTSTESTAWYIHPTKVDAGSNKTALIYRNAPIKILDSNNDIDYSISVINKNFGSLNTTTALFNLGTTSTVNGSNETLGKKPYWYAGQIRAFASNKTGANAGVIYGLDLVSSRGRLGKDDGGPITSIVGVSNIYGHFVRPSGASPSGTTTNVYGYFGQANTASGTITNMYDIFVQAYSTANTSTATITNKYGIVIKGDDKQNILDGSLEVNGLGFRFPRKSTLDITATPSPTEALSFWNTEKKCLFIYNGTQWSCIDGTNATAPITTQLGKDKTALLNGFVSPTTDARLLAYSSGGALTQLNIDNAGAGYKIAPTLTISGGGATTNATATATIDSTTGAITNVTINTAGAGYTSNPTVTITTNYSATDTTVDHSTVTGSQKFSEVVMCQSKPISVTGCGGSTTLTVGTNTYNIVEINGQCWFAQNLREIPSSYSDAPNTGKNIWLNTAASTAPDADYGKWGYYNTATVNGSAGWATTESASLPGAGLLYQWKAAMNGSTAERSQGACPTGWHIPSDCELMFLEHGLGLSKATIITTGVRENLATQGNVGKKLKNYGTQQNNISGFKLVATGWRISTNGSLNGGASTGQSYYWSSTESNDNAFYRYESSGDYGSGRSSAPKLHALPVRCLKD